MSLSHCSGGSSGQAGRRTLVRWAADGLALAASPIFALMALLTGAWGGGPDQMLCTGEGDAMVGGMATMYLLMGVLHLAPWLTLMDDRKRRPT